MISEKIRPHHLERKALLYVRQSSAHQVLHNRESSALQYAMRDRLTVLGWSEIEVIDEDLGRSAAGSVHALDSSGRFCANDTGRQIKSKLLHVRPERRALHNEPQLDDMIKPLSRAECDGRTS